MEVQRNLPLENQAIRHLWGGCCPHPTNTLINPRACQVCWHTRWARNLSQHPHWEVWVSFWGIQEGAHATSCSTSATAALLDHLPNDSHTHTKSRLTFCKSGHQTLWHQERWLKTLSYEERLKELNMSNLAKQWVRGDTIKDSRHPNEGSGAELKNWIVRMNKISFWEMDPSMISQEIKYKPHFLGI